MSNVVYSVSTISSVIASSSPRCLQWTPDGQLCFLTKNAVYIVTPDHGINFDADPFLSSSNKGSWQLGWFNTMIEMDKIEPTRWTDYSQSWASLSLGSIDNFVVSVAISPTGLTKNGGCVIATLSANMDLVLWKAGKNFVKGEWVKVSVTLSVILARIDPEKDILQAQITSVEWTPQVNFDLMPMPRLDGSLLVLGSRAGFVTLLRYHDDDFVEYLQTLSVSEQWITHLSFDSWSLVSPGCYEGQLAYGSSDGSIGLIKISQKLEQLAVRSFTPRYDIKVAMEDDPRLVYQADNSSRTLLQWVSIPGRTSILTSSNPGVLKLFSQSHDPSTSYWTGYRVIRFTTQKTPRASSSLYPVSGLAYLPKLDALVATLTDGSFHVVQNLSVDPKGIDSSVVQTENPKEWLTSDALSQTARTIFQITEKGNVARNDLSKIHGAISYDSDATLLLAYEIFCPSDFSYKQDSKRTSTLIVSQFWTQNAPLEFVENLSFLLSSVKSCWGLSPLHMLRPYLLRLGDTKCLQECYDRVLDILQPVSNDDCSKRVIVPSWDSSEADDKLREHFRISLQTNMYGWDELLSLRMRLSLADFAWKSCGDEEIQNKCGVVAGSILNAITTRITRIIIRHLLAVAGSMNATELPFASLLVVQSSLHVGEQDLISEGNNLSTLLHPIFRSAVGGSENVEDQKHLDEICPACGVVIPLEDMTSARCINGHSWPRCSVTTFVLSTSWVRTCVGCCRKAFLPVSALDENLGQELPVLARSWVVEELLEAVTKCLFCGNGFITIL